MIKPSVDDEGKRTRLTSIKVNKNKTTSENPKTIRFTAAEKVLCAELVNSIQDLTTKNISDSTLIRAALYLAQEAGPEEVLRLIKEHL